ncbi:hypothetical protein BKI52_07205 [marine bacterium AO1-C]|nr:hypothetical protein BKI52_07205 [marine bacterium AO1-C]
MIIYQILLYTTIAIVVLSLLALTTVDNSQAIITKGVVTLPASKIFYYLGITCFTLGIFCLLLPWLSYEEDDWWLMLQVMSTLGIVFVIGAIFLWLTYRHHRLSFDRHEFWVTSFRSKSSTRQSWENLEEIRWSLLSGKITLLLKDGTRLKFTQFLSGLPEFINAVEKRTPLKVKKFREYHQKSKDWYKQDLF